MNATQGYSFRAAAMDDLPLLLSWQARPHVRAWWDDDAPYDETDLVDQRLAHWIVSHDGHPFAFMQDYAVHGWADHHFAHLPRGTRGIDQYIGDPDMMGQGHGPAFIGLRMQVIFAAGAPMIATDPHPKNARAIAAYRKIGFTPIGPEQETPWGLILPMTACPGR